ncbi:BppU family phage baseplate upper protein [Bacillus paranthracis]|uniref:BppU family phage baseplate upper protein n=1 Tax=Bacillus paranthracis TaxID=2026186 RepID=UPI0013D580D1|nr:polysaccharide deacetylase family protein [Bacillus paranthracis]
MANIQFFVDLDLIDKYVPAEDITVVQESYQSVEFFFNINKNGSPVDLTGATDFIFALVKPDGHVVLQDDAVLENGKVKVVVNPEAFTAKGKIFYHMQYKIGTATYNTRQAFAWVEQGNTSCQALKSTDYAPFLDQSIELGKLFGNADNVPEIIAAPEVANSALAQTNINTESICQLENKAEEQDANLEATKELANSAVLSSTENTNQIGILSENVTNNTTDLTKQRITVNRPALELNSVSSQIPMVTFIDDDGTLAVQTKLKPLAIEKKIPFTLAIVSDFMMGLATDGGLSPAGFMNVSQVRDLYKNYGFEIQSHSATHLAIGSLADKEQWYEIKSSYEKLNQLGFDVEYLIYPYGSNNKAAREKVSKYYKGAIGTSNGLNVPPVSTFGLKRVPFGSFTEGQNSLDFYKSKVDEAIANNQWLIFMLHVGNPEHDATQQQHLSDLIDYIKTKPIKIATVKEGYEIYGNLIDYNDQEIYFSKLGKNNIKDFIRDPLDPKTGIEKYNFSKKPNEFERGKVFNTNVYNDNANSPSGARGMLTTYTQDNDGTEAYQTFNSRQKIYERHSTSSTAWGPWRRRFIAEESTALSGNFGDIPPMGAVSKDLTINGLAAGNPVILTPTTDFPKGIMFSYTITAGWILTVTLFNVTGAPITVGTKTFNALVMK